MTTCTAWKATKAAAAQTPSPATKACRAARSVSRPFCQAQTASHRQRKNPTPEAAAGTPAGRPPGAARRRSSASLYTARACAAKWPAEYRSAVARAPLRKAARISGPLPSAARAAAKPAASFHCQPLTPSSTTPSRQGSARTMAGSPQASASK